MKNEKLSFDIVGYIKSCGFSKIKIDYLDRELFRKEKIHSTISIYTHGGFLMVSEKWHNVCGGVCHLQETVLRTSIPKLKEAFEKSETVNKEC